MINITVASRNAGKIAEIKSILPAEKFSVMSQVELNISDIAETGLTFIENALIKARHVAAQIQGPVIADDSGLIIPKLNGEPGLYSARFAEKHHTELSNNDYLLARLQQASLTNPSAYYYCIIVYLRHALDAAPILCVGTWHGEIINKPAGSQGFGYDPLFYLPKLNCTAAQLSLTEKNRISHRGQALQQLLTQLDNEVLN